MKQIAICIFCIILFAISASGQTDCTVTPRDCALVSKAALVKALTDSDTVKAQAAEIMTLREAVVKQKEVTVDVKIELAKAIGQLTGAQQELVSARAMLDFVMKNGRNKCGGFTIFCMQK